MLNKKAQGLSLNTIIIAAIVLIVLVVLAIIFMTRTGDFTGRLDDCEGKGGVISKCTQTSAKCVADGGIPSGPCIHYKDGKRETSKENMVCCPNRE